MRTRNSVKKLSANDIKAGADKLHDLLDGRIYIPERLAVLLIGTGAAVIPLLTIWLLWRAV